MCHSFLQGSRTLSGHFVAEEGDLGGAEDALRRVYQDPVFLRPAEESPEVLFMLQICKTEVESPQHLVHESL
jgi:hypothetical protein